MAISSINIHIKVKNFQQSLAFYESLGFKKVSSFGPDQEVKEQYSGADFQYGNTILEIADGHRGVKPHVFQETVNSSKISLFIQVDSISEMLAICKKAGIEPVVGVRHYHWGKLEFVVRDPDGVIIVFFSPYTKEEAKKVHADESYSVNPHPRGV
ncbi:MAG: VOC family protein [Candidatus Gottesmanbacteria bacterium]|nr:VOC family protein [Candidatus Gottesmanbacteria bacterium]